MFIIALLAVIFGLSKVLKLWSNTLDFNIIDQNLIPFNITSNFIKGFLMFEALVETFCGLYILFL